MIFSDADLEIVNELLVPSMGTETLASLLHFLVRFTRAQNVLEGGAGYTTPFLAMALAKNKIDFAAELKALQCKTELYLTELDSNVMSNAQSHAVERPLDALPIGLGALYSQKATLLAQKRFEWLSEHPSWARPSYYLQSYEPKLLCLDDFRHNDSSAPQVRSVIERLGLSNYVTFRNEDFWTCTSELIPSEDKPFDLIWIDLPVGVRGLIDLLQGNLWNSLRPDGGLLLIHDMMTTRGGQALVDELKKQQKNVRFADFELVGFLEPQRLMQGDFILVRKTSGSRVLPVDDVIQRPGRDTLEQEAEALMKQPKA
jgi:predicted O-methyltransferase YrrM